jgi:MoaA/NifB/PqqE/SkfB family radical SAM enzyme
LLFVSHPGDICPSGFLPLAAGNVRRDSLVEVYRESYRFRTLRDEDPLEASVGSVNTGESAGARVPELLRLPETTGRRTLAACISPRC